MNTDIEKFINENKEVFKILAKHIKEIDTVRGVDSLQEMRGRKIAIRIVEGWLKELWGIAKSEDLPQDDEMDDIYKLITKESLED